ncbi:hypothetical protein D9757_011610 [Collybiopsis confluens]|uniref:beta-glucosidase n=1 Tax=Collybiopsis confluens TaxID=2823264 RepID=A0A8H5LWY6_9AGAR|nr:hypothetical protein D9757_011610 [Collybiopsis confluens]
MDSARTVLRLVLALAPVDVQTVNEIRIQRKNLEETSAGLEIDYRAFDAPNITPRYEFGFGLSYTTFEYSGLSIGGVRDTDNAQADLISNWEAGNVNPSGFGTSTAPTGDSRDQKGDEQSEGIDGFYETGA